jgi:glyoxylase I family protein
MTEIIGIDHIYVAVSDLGRSEAFYDKVLLNTLDFRKNTFTLDGDLHIQYFNRHFGYVLSLSRIQTAYNSYAPGLHHCCFRVDSAAEVKAVASQLRSAGIEVSGAKPYPQYAPDYWAAFY